MNVVSRRSLLKVMGGAGLGLGLAPKVWAVIDDGAPLPQDHFVLADKGLSAEWKRSLYARGTKEVWRGDDLETIGMPIGGIAAGQLYLCGDGTLGCWELFNYHQFLGWGATSYAKRAIEQPVDFGFTLTVDGKKRSLDKSGFTEVSFEGRYPAGTVRYSDADCPVDVQMVAFSPFIPGNAKDSALPATMFEFSVTNHGSSEVNVSIAGHLENVVAKSAEQHPGSRRRSTQFGFGKGLTYFTLSADPAESEFDAPVTNPRPAMPLATFEGDAYGDWNVSGEAFGPGPAAGTLKNQNPVTGFEGKKLVNSYFNGDDTKGRLVSPTFKIERSFINFKIGGGNHATTCMNLIVDGKIVRTASGLNDELLLWDAWSVKDLLGKAAHIEILDNQVGAWGHINVDAIEMADEIRSPEEVKRRRGDVNRDHGSMSLLALSEAPMGKNATYPFDKKHIETLAAQPMKVKPGETVHFYFALTWYFPHHVNGRNYSNWFANSSEVARYVFDNFWRLSADTHKWCDTYYDSTLPYWLLDRLHSTAGNLSTGTTEWWSNGRFWAWEGVVSCEGTCTHVWNYEQTLARLFPEIERNIRVRQDFGEGFDEATGLVGFRGRREYATDGQCGTILKAYREHLTSANDDFLFGVWSKVKKALEFVIKQDADRNGLVENGQPNTYDIDFFGPNTFVGSLYLAALKAGAEMAREVGDENFGRECLAIFEKGSAATVARLWNGEYFVQEVDQVKFGQFQYGPGCLSDQLFGQGWAHQIGLGYLYPEDKVKTALRSIWKYNWASDVAKQNEKWKPERPFAVPGEAGLLVCTWPRGGRQAEPVRYRDEVWTGIEYQVAGHMIWEGLVEEGLSIVKAIHERYHPAKRNPYNEVECGDHYARAMASWGVLTALSGFEYNGSRGVIGFEPRVTPENFKSVFTAAEGWGTFNQSFSPGNFQAEIKVKHGSLSLNEIKLFCERKGELKVTAQGQARPFQFVSSNGHLSIRLDDRLFLKEGESITITI